MRMQPVQRTRRRNFQAQRSQQHTQIFTRAHLGIDTEPQGESEIHAQSLKTREYYCASSSQTAHRFYLVVLEDEVRLNEGESESHY